MISALPSGWLSARASAERLRAAAAPFDGGARVLKVTPTEYLSDPCRAPTLSASIAHTIVSESPLHAWQRHPRLGGSLSTSSSNGSKAKDDGSLIHRLLLGKGKDIELVPFYDFRTNAAKAIRDAATSVGKLPVLQHVLEERGVAAVRLKEKLEQRGYSLSGESELAIEWTETCAEVPVRCRSMLDHVFRSKGKIYDLKSCASANPRKIARTFVEYGYDIEYVAHTRALAQLCPALKCVDFTFLFLEIEPPYEIVPVKPDGQLLEIGRLRWENAVRTWHECLEENRWPGYAPEGQVVMLEPPPWVVTQELGTWQQ
jgi:PDDEXK-like domain of unknown function (DUF3799)